MKFFYSPVKLSHIFRDVPEQKNSQAFFCKTGYLNLNVTQGYCNHRWLHFNAQIKYIGAYLSYKTNPSRKSCLIGEWQNLKNVYISGKKVHNFAKSAQLCTLFWIRFLQTLGNDVRLCLGVKKFSWLRFIDIYILFSRPDFCYGDGGGLKMALNRFLEKVVKKVTFFWFFWKKVRVIQKKVSFGPTRKYFLLIFVANERSTI